VSTSSHRRDILAQAASDIRRATTQTAPEQRDYMAVLNEAKRVASEITAAQRLRQHSTVAALKVRAMALKAEMEAI